MASDLGLHSLSLSSLVSLGTRLMLCSGEILSPEVLMTLLGMGHKLVSVRK